MNLEMLLYEAGIVLLAAAMLAVSAALKKLGPIAARAEPIWVLPAAGASLLFLSLAAHAYAGFSLFPGLEEQVKLLSADEVLFNAEKLAAVKAAIRILRQQVLMLKAFSFTCFFAAAVLLAASTGVYIRWISK